MIEKIITPIENNIILPNPAKLAIKPKAKVESKLSILLSNNKEIPVVSRPVHNQNTRVINMSELKSNQDNDIVVPMAHDSLIILVNGGMKLPNGLDKCYL